MELVIEQSPNISPTYASFVDPHDAERAYGALADHGVKPAHVTVIASQNVLAPEIAWETEAKIEGMAEKGITVTSTEDAAKAAVPGAAIGLGFGALAAIAALAIPGVGLVLGGGALIAAAAGAAGATAAGAVAGGVYGYLKDQGMDDSSAQVMQGAFANGHVLIAVRHNPPELPMASDVVQILQKYNGQILGSDTVPGQRAERIGEFIK